MSFKESDSGVIPLNTMKFWKADRFSEDPHNLEQVIVLTPDGTRRFIDHLKGVCFSLNPPLITIVLDGDRGPIFSTYNWRKDPVVLQHRDYDIHLGMGAVFSE